MLDRRIHRPNERYLLVQFLPKNALTGLKLSEVEVEWHRGIQHTDLQTKGFHPVSHWSPEMDTVVRLWFIQRPAGKCGWAECGDVALEPSITCYQVRGWCVRGLNHPRQWGIESLNRASEVKFLEDCPSAVGRLHVSPPWDGCRNHKYLLPRCHGNYKV